LHQLSPLSSVEESINVIEDIRKLKNVSSLLILAEDGWKKGADEVFSGIGPHGFIVGI
jgi:hypothetical protein